MGKAVSHIGANPLVRAPLVKVSVLSRCRTFSDTVTEQPKVNS
jgi:hypothetical protein